MFILCCFPLFIFSAPKLYLCEFCLKYMKTRTILKRHLVNDAFFYSSIVCLIFVILILVLHGAGSSLERNLSTNRFFFTVRKYFTGQKIHSCPESFYFIRKKSVHLNFYWFARFSWAMLLPVN